MVTHYKLPGNLDMKLSSFSKYYKAVISAVVGTKQAQMHTSIFGIYVYSKRKYFLTDDQNAVSYTGREH